MKVFRRYPVLATFVLATLLGWGPAAAATFVVNSTGDASDAVPGDGTCTTAGAVCTLRAAIEEANAFTGTDNIQFNIGGGGLQTIVPGSALPSITSVVRIDGTTQPGFVSTPIIELSAAACGANGALNLGLGSSGSTIRGLVINRCPTRAIRIIGSSNNVIVGNFLGTNPAGTAAGPGNAVGVYISTGGVATNNNRIGGVAALDRNVISGNTADGIQVNGAVGGAANTIIENNYIGVDVSGTVPVGNGGQGVAVFGTNTNTLIGGTAATSRNVISGNGNDGILIANAGTTGTLVQGNYIGTDRNGVAAIGNLRGISIQASASANTIGGTAAGAGNVISGNSLTGVEIIHAGTSGNRVTGNLIGVDASGTAILGNSFTGVTVAQSATGNIIGEAGGGNVISGNGQYGVRIVDGGTNNNLVQSNFIGLDATGSFALGNAIDGVRLEAGVPASSNVVGGVGLGNVISGNAGIGVRIFGSMTTTRVSANIIGRNAANSATVPNAGGGVRIQSSSGNTIGGTGLNEGNVIAGDSAGDGVAVVGTANSNAVLGNSIFSNAGLGIDLGDDGVTPNDVGDADTGPNNLQNFPVLSGATTDGVGNVHVAGSLNGVAATATYRVEFFAHTSPDPTGFGEGRRYLGFVNVTTNAAGYAVVAATLPAAVTATVDYVTATATDASNNTSEFAGNVTAVGDLVVTTTSDAADGNTTSVATLIANPGADGRISLREAIVATNATAGADTIRFGIPLTDAGHFYYQNDSIPSSLSTTAATTLADADITDFDPDYPGTQFSWYRIRPTAALPAITGSLTIDGATQPGASPNTLTVGNDAVLKIELDGSLVGAGVNGLTVNATTSTVRGLVINRFTDYGIRVGAAGASIQGNFVGTNVAGTEALGNSRGGVGVGGGVLLIAGGATIGGTAPSARNVVSGNTAGCAWGIELWESNGNTIQGNYVGTNAAGTASIGNGCGGVALDGNPGVGSDNNLIGGTAAGAGNLISGNLNEGLFLANGSNGNTIQGNVIGRNASGAAVLPNASRGVKIASPANLVGGVAAGAGNVISGNTAEGVRIEGATSTGNAVIGNRIYENGALGIDLLGDGVTPNDAGDVDTGPNDLLNFPVLTSVVELAGTLSVSFQLDVPAGWYRVEFFKNPAGGDPSGYGEGQIFASSTNVNHPGGGAMGFNHSFGGAFGDLLTATATFCTDGATCAAFGSTSELGNAITALGGATLSSTANQSFTVGDPSTPMFASDIVVSAAGVVTTTNDLRIRIPSGYPMRWNPAQTSLVRGGTAALKVAPTVLGFEDSGRTVVIDVTSDFTSGDQLNLSGLEFFSFTAPAPVAKLELETANDGLAIAFDDKTKQILPDALPTLSSDDDQTFVTGQPATLTVPLTVSEGLSPSITLGNDIRVRIPAPLTMTWDPGVTVPFFSGPAATKVAATVGFEDIDRTLVIDVQANFVSGDFLTVSGLYFKGFGTSPPSNLELEVDNLGSVIDLDDKTIQIELARDVPVFTATATTMQVKLEWVYPSGSCNFVRIVRDTAGFPAPGDLTLLADVPCGASGTKGSLVDSPLTPNTTYYYSAYVDYGAGYTSGKFLKARPFDSPPSIHWAYSTGATTMAPPGLRFASPDSFVYLASNDSVLHSIRGGSLGGDWPGAWTPYVLGGPAQNRFPVVSFSVGGGNGAAFLGSQDGRVYAVDAVNGTLTWDQPVASMVQAAPAGHFQYYAPAAFDLLLVGTRDSSGANAFAALDVDTGTPAWSFVNSVGQGGSGAALGIISGSASVDYPQNRAYFASRTHSTGSNHTLWCVTFTPTTVTRVWSQPLGNIDGSPILKNGRVYVGTNGGVLYALDAATGALKWSLALSDGPIKGFPFPGGANQLFLSTNGKVWSVVDNGSSGSVSPGWPVSSIPSPSIPLHIPGTTDVLVGSSDGKLYQMNVATPLPANSVLLGDGSAAVGAPTMDLLQMLLYVGTDAGVVYGVTYPIPPP